MKHTKTSTLTNDKGLTLIEILAAIVILTIIVISFLSIFVQSARTNNASETIIDATYVAQKEMEEIYHLTNIVPSGLSNLKIEASGNYDKKGPTHYTRENSGYYTTIEIKNNSESENLANVIIRIYNASTSSKIEAQMEGVFQWKD